MAWGRCPQLADGDLKQCAWAGWGSFSLPYTLGAILKECVLVPGLSVSPTQAAPMPRWEMGMLPVWDWSDGPITEHRSGDAW